MILCFIWGWGEYGRGECVESDINIYNVKRICNRGLTFFFLPKEDPRVIPRTSAEVFR